MFLQAIPILQERFPIQRARMRLQVLVPSENEAEMLARLKLEHADVESKAYEHSTSLQAAESNELSVICLVDPGGFRRIFNFINEAFGKRGAVQVVLT